MNLRNGIRFLPGISSASSRELGNKVVSERRSMPPLLSWLFSSARASHSRSSRGGSCFVVAIRSRACLTPSFPSLKSRVGPCSVGKNRECGPSGPPLCLLNDKPFVIVCDCYFRFFTIAATSRWAIFGRGWEPDIFKCHFTLDSLWSSAEQCQWFTWITVSFLDYVSLSYWSDQSWRFFGTLFTDIFFRRSITTTLNNII